MHVPYAGFRPFNSGLLRLVFADDRRFDPGPQYWLTEGARQAEDGEAIVATRHGKPVFDLKPRRPRVRLNFAAIAEFTRP